MIDNPSSERPMEPESFDRGNPARRCTAHRKNGDRCRKWAIRGGNVCTHHGGKARQTVEKARRRLAENADRGAKQLLALAFDKKQPAEIRLKATLQLLDRAGVNAKTAVDVEVAVRPWEMILGSVSDSLESGSRSEYRARIGNPEPSPAPADEPTPAAFESVDHSILDAEIVAEEPETEKREHDPDVDVMNVFGGPLGPFGPAGGGMMSLEDAVAAQAEMSRQAVRSDRGQRALPPGQFR